MLCRCCKRKMFALRFQSIKSFSSSRLSVTATFSQQESPWRWNQGCNCGRNMTTSSLPCLVLKWCWTVNSNIIASRIMTRRRNLSECAVMRRWWVECTQTSSKQTTRELNRIKTARNLWQKVKLNFCSPRALFSHIHYRSSFNEIAFSRAQLYFSLAARSRLFIELLSEHGLQQHSDEVFNRSISIPKEFIKPQFHKLCVFIAQ